MNCHKPTIVEVLEDVAQHDRVSGQLAFSNLQTHQHFVPRNAF
jgi:hypothetical protein